MKFSAKIVDQGSAETFSKVVHTVAKLCKLCVLRIGADKMCFVHKENHKETAHSLWIEIMASQIFEDYRMDGLSPEANEVVIEVAPEELAQVMRPALQAKLIRMKLTKKDNLPHITFEIKPQTSVGGSKQLVTHDIPVQVVAQRNWAEYDKPNVSRVKVAINLPPVKTLNKVILGMKNMKAKHVTFSANNEGDLNVEVETDSTNVVAFFSQLSNVSLMVEDADPGSSQMTERRMAEKKSMYSVCVDIRALLLFLPSQQLTISRLALHIIEKRLAVFVIEQDDEGVQLQYSIPGVSL